MLNSSNCNVVRPLLFLLLLLSLSFYTFGQFSHSNTTKECTIDKEDYLEAEITKTTSKVVFEFYRDRVYHLLIKRVENGQETVVLDRLFYEKKDGKAVYKFEETGTYRIGFCGHKNFCLFRKWTRFHLDKGEDKDEDEKSLIPKTETVTFTKTDGGNDQVVATVEDEEDKKKGSNPEGGRE